MFLKELHIIIYSLSLKIN